MRPLPLLTSSRRRLLPLLALPVLLVAGIGVTGQRGATSPTSDASAITIAGFAFDPVNLEVPSGTRVTWTNQDSAAHSIRDSTGAIPESADLGQGDSFEATFTTPGEYSYICGIHPDMRGTVIVI